LLAQLKNPKQFISTNDRHILKNNIFRDFEQGMSKKDIASKYNMGHNLIIKILNNSIWQNIGLDASLNYLICDKITQLTNEQAINLIKDFCEDMSPEELLMKYSTTTMAIINILQRKTFKNINIGELEVQLLGKNTKRLFVPKTKLDIAGIFSMYANGFTMKNIGIKYNIDVRTVSDILHREYHKTIHIDKDIENKVAQFLKDNLKRNRLDLFKKKCSQQ
jgi:Mor family transcriptional regulator